MSREQFLLTAHFYFEARGKWFFSETFDVFCHISAIFRAFCLVVKRNFCKFAVVIVIVKSSNYEICVYR